MVIILVNDSQMPPSHCRATNCISPVPLSGQHRLADIADLSSSVIAAAPLSVPASGLALMHVMWVIWQRLSRSVEYIDPADVEVTWIDQRREPAATWTPWPVRL
jgi:hypothetical protein